MNSMTKYKITLPKLPGMNVGSQNYHWCPVVSVMIGGREHYVYGFIPGEPYYDARHGEFVQTIEWTTGQYTNQWGHTFETYETRHVEWDANIRVQSSEEERDGKIFDVIEIEADEPFAVEKAYIIHSKSGKAIDGIVERDGVQLPRNLSGGGGGGSIAGTPKTSLPNKLPQSVLVDDDD